MKFIRLRSPNRVVPCFKALHKILGAMVTVALLTELVGCRSYAGKEVTIHLSTQPQLQGEAAAELAAYVVPPAQWDRMLRRQRSQDGYNRSTGQAPPVPYFPVDGAAFDGDLASCRVREGSPPVTTSVQPYRAIYVVKMPLKDPSAGQRYAYFWTEIAPSFDSPNQFTVGVNPHAAGPE